MSKHIGIVACSAEGSSLCYRTICVEAAQFMGEHHHPEITIHTYPLSDYLTQIRQDNWEQVAQLMLSSAHKVAQTGAEFVICPVNTIHQVFKWILGSPMDSGVWVFLERDTLWRDPSILRPSKSMV